jgi:hypothetical protein
MKAIITAYVGLDSHAESTAIAVGEIESRPSDAMRLCWQDWHGLRRMRASNRQERLSTPDGKCSF